MDTPFLLHERTCPYIDAARTHAEACTIEVSVIEMLTGMSADLDCCMARGDEGCTYRLQPRAEARS